MHLEEFGYQAVFIGFSFAVPTLIYATTSPLIYVITSNMKKSGVICIGYMIVCLSFFLIGPSQLLGIYNSPSITVVGLAIMGFGCGMIIIPIMPDMIESVEERYPTIDEQELHNNISGLFIAFQGIGETSGPIMGSVFESFYGFRLAQDYMGLIVLFFLILYFVFCGRLSLFKLKNKQ